MGEGGWRGGGDSRWRGGVIVGGEGGDSGWRGGGGGG